MPSNGSDAGSAVSFGAAQLLTLLIARWRVALGLPLAAALVVVVTVLVWPASYTTRTTFMPQSMRVAGGGLANMAMQFGISVPGQDPTQSPDFYAALLRSRELGRFLVHRPYDIDDREVSLLDTFDSDPDDPVEVRVLTAIDELQRHLTVRTTSKTNSVHLTVRTVDPGLSMAIAVRALSLVDSFNITMRQSGASAEATFAQARLLEARDSLRAAENVVQDFLERNREFRSAPQLTFEFERLNRRVMILQATYTTLVQAVEQARIEAVRNTPVITIIEHPRVAARADRRQVLLKGSLTFILVALIIVGLLFLEVEFGFYFSTPLAFLRSATDSHRSGKQ